MNDDQLLRYSRQIMLPAVEYEGQQRLLDSRVLIIGMGGLGSPVAMYLAAAGVGQLVISDDDQVDLSNLQRQIIHSTADVGSAKTHSAKQTLQALNPDVHVETVDRRLSPQELAQYAGDVDVVVDASDNFDTRFLVNEACVATRKPLVSGAAIRLEGQVAVFRNDREGGPCYRCLYRDSGELTESCSESGVLAPIVGVIGSIQALETVKVLLNVGKNLDERLLLLDGTTMEWREIRLKKDPHCPVCSHHQI
ncbi:MAG: molybdopterin-synthase adenylyltransferase MoeB [Gammaproteobacteria bacterium]|jgi:adenylyltransferase/sulfurtransferase